MHFPDELKHYETIADPIDGAALGRLLPRRDRFAHKGDFGHILVTGGSAGFGGAPALAALAALRTARSRGSPPRRWRIRLARPTATSPKTPT